MKPYYDQDGITIYHGDCQEILPQLPQCDLLLTDPPYGIGAARADFRSWGNLAPAKDYGNAEWDNEPIDEELLQICRHKGMKQIIWGGNFYTLPPSSCWLVWDKRQNNDYADCELAWTNLVGAVRIFRWRWSGFLQENMGNREYRWHPTQKPLALMKWCIVKAGDGVKTILDPFAGSGTTIRAAKDLGLHCIGIEIEEKYCEIAANRCRQMIMDFTFGSKK